MREFARIVSPLEVEMIETTNQIFMEHASSGVVSRINAYGYATAEEVMDREG
jgi:hypothetical protein